MNNWHKIYNKRSFDKSVLDSGDKLKIYRELKKCDGFDLSDTLTAGDLKQHYDFLKKNMTKYSDGTDMSIFEVGCGSGANLFMFESDGFTTGGIDYAANMIEIARSVLRSDDLTAGEAASLSVDRKYDFVISDSVFQYFEGYDYARSVVDRMIEKANYSVVVLDVLDSSKKDEFYEYRRSIDPDYDIKYAGLDKRFYDRRFFIDAANENNMSIEFIESGVDEYWNSRFVFNCFMFHDR